jgi:hypothetical protein
MDNFKDNKSEDPLLTHLKNNLDQVRFSELSLFKNTLKNLEMNSINPELMDYCLRQYPLEKTGLNQDNFQFWFNDYCVKSGLLDNDTIKILCHHLQPDYIPILFHHAQGLPIFQNYHFSATLIENNNLQAIETFFALVCHDYSNFGTIEHNNFKKILTDFYLQSYYQHNEESLSLVYDCIENTYGLDMVHQNYSLSEDADYIKALIKLNPDKYYPDNLIFLHHLILEWSLSGNFEDEPEFHYVLDYGISRLYHQHHSALPLFDLWNKLTFEKHDAPLCYALLKAIDFHSPEDVRYLSPIFQKTDNPQIRHMVARFCLKQNLDKKLSDNNDFSFNQETSSPLKIKI